MSKTKTKTSTKTLVVTAAIVAAAAAAGFGLARPSGPGITIIAEYTGPTERVVYGDNALLLSMEFTARARDLTVSSVNFDIVGEDDADLATIENDHTAVGSLYDCTLKNDLGIVYAGPVDPSSSDSIEFIDDFDIMNGDPMRLSLYCNLSANFGSGDSDLFFARIESSENIVVTDLSGSELPAESTQLGFFGTGINADGQRASMTTIEQGNATFSLSDSSPDGSDLDPGRIEVFRFNVTADESGTIAVESVTVGTALSDNDVSGWNTCAHPSSSTGLRSSDFEVYNLTTIGASSPVLGSIALFAGDGSNCSAGSELKYVGLAGLNIGSVALPAGETYTYAVYMDASDASESHDDTIQFYIPSESEMTSLPNPKHAVLLVDDASNALFGDEVIGLPLHGHTLSF